MNLLNPTSFLKRLCGILSLLPWLLCAQTESSPLEETLLRAKVLYHAGAHTQSRLLYEKAAQQVERDEERDIIAYNIGSSLLAEGEPQAALDLWSSTPWAPSPAPWLTRRLSWNVAIAQIQKAAHLDSKEPEGQLEQLRLLHGALKMLHITAQAECTWHEALSKDPCTPTLKLQEARGWTEARLFVLQKAFRRWWIEHASALDLVGGILATMERFRENSTLLDCTEALQHLLPYEEALHPFPSLELSLHSALVQYKEACTPPFDANKLHQAREDFTKRAMRFSYPLYLNQASKSVRLLYAQGLAEGGNLLHALKAAQQHRSLLKGSQEGQWAERCALLGEEAFTKGQFDAARLLWQLTCFWLDEQADILDHPPSLQETGERLLNRHLWTQFFTTHLTFFPENIDRAPLIEALTRLVQSTLGTAASLFSLARETQLRAFEANTCSPISWEQALPSISHGETPMHQALRLLQEGPSTYLANQPAIISTIQHAYPFWVDGVHALTQTSSTQEQTLTSTTPPTPSSSSSDKPFSLQQRTLLLQEMEAEDRPATPQNAPPPSEVRPW